MKGEDHKGRRCHGGFLFFHTDKDQFERLRLLVIRYKMVVGGLVCQKSIAGAIYFTLPTGSYSEDSPASTHTRNIIKWFTPDSSFSGICSYVLGYFYLKLFLHFFFFLSSTYLLSHCYSAGGHAGAFGARPLSLQMRLAAGIFFTQRLQRGRGRESFLRTTFIGHSADLHSGV